MVGGIVPILRKPAARAHESLLFFFRSGSGQDHTGGPGTASCPGPFFLLRLDCPETLQALAPVTCSASAASLASSFSAAALTSLLSSPLISVEG
jgi:hypothetical protein